MQEEKQEKLMKKQLNWIRFQSMVMSLILILMCAFTVTVFVGVTQIQDKLDRIDIDALNTTIEALDSAAENLSTFDMETVNATIASLNGAAANLKEFDVEALSKLVNTLNNVASRLEAVTNLFKR